MNELAPIVLFTYKRLDTLKLTIAALSNNFLASDSELYIFSDGPKTVKDQNIINEIRIYLKTLGGFKSITIMESPSNKGLSKSIIEGVTKIISIYGKVIIVEDDLITSKNFLTFMNSALKKYESNNEVFSISGYSFNMYDKNFKHDGYFLNRGCPWGWATWKNRWEIIDWEMKKYDLFTNDNFQKKEFSKLGSDLNKMLKNTMEGKISSWYIIATFHQFNVKQITIYPYKSKIINVGFDEFSNNTKGRGKRYKTDLDSSNNSNFALPDELKVNDKFQKSFKYKFSKFNRIKFKVLDLFLN